MKLKIRKKEIAAVIAIVSITAFIMYPVLKTSSTPGWVGKAGCFMKTIGSCLDRYQTDHDGKLPGSLAELYPKYVNDPRITKNPVEISRNGKQMWMTYYKPKNLHNPNTAVAELRLHPDDKSKYPKRGIVLRANLSVQFTK
ncbi:MAG: hypothetical protein ABFD46_06295 [Armatimonadota bacterium]